MNAVATKKTSKKMTDAEYKVRRTQINEQVEALQELVDKAIMHRDAYRDQGLAKLFYDSGWLQKKLAAQEGKSEPWICYRLRFGSFLNWLESEKFTSGEFRQAMPKNLTERRFRSYWEQTSGTKDAARFRKVWKAMQGETVVHTPRGKTLQKVEEHCKSGEYQEQIATATGSGNC